MVLFRESKWCGGGSQGVESSVLSPPIHRSFCYVSGLKGEQVRLLTKIQFDCIAPIQETQLDESEALRIKWGFLSEQDKAT